MIRVIRAGLLTSVQDLGRVGQQHYGIIVSGSMDPYAHQVANLLVGNPMSEATLEMTLLGPTLEFQEEALISICGGDLQPRVDGRPVPSWSPVMVGKGTVLELGVARTGCRAYLAVAGGFDVPRVLGSKSTYLRAGIGGFYGRALQDGDEVPLHSAVAAESLFTGMLPGDAAGAEMIGTTGVEWVRRPGIHTACWSVGWDARTGQGDNPSIRVIPGPEYNAFTDESKLALEGEQFAVSPQSDRMGYRLTGSKLTLREGRDMLSEGVTTGTLQVPLDGHPILLMADHQTTGGYPRIAQVAAVDIPVVAQRKPGDNLRFQMISLAEAQSHIRRQSRELQRLASAIAWKRKNGGDVDASSRLKL
jgi:antagonist of KipI